MAKADPPQPARTSLLRRIGSVAKRAWVIVVLAMPVFIAAIWTYESLAKGLFGWTGVAILFAIVVVIDAYRRRCPACRKWLAGLLLRIRDAGSYEQHSTVNTPQGVVNTTHTVNTHHRDWRCNFCDHRWTT